MKVTDVAILPIDDTMPPAAKWVRARAPKLIASVIDDTDALSTVTSIEELRSEHIQALSGGVDAATYLVNKPDEQVIIKLSTSGVDAEAEALEAWRKRHVRVPKMIKTGIVPITKHTKHPIKYLVQQALLDRDGRLIETAVAYLTRAPKNARRIGRALGQELTKLHSAVSHRRFGEFKDAVGSRSAYGSWNAYIAEAFSRQFSYLKKLGINPEDMNRVVALMRAHSFVKKGRYLHGDFSIRNVAVKSHDPLKISIFDPNPVIGDPSWDVSVLVNNYEFAKRRLKYDDSQQDLYTLYQQVWVGFKQGYKRKIDEVGLLTAQLVQGIYQAQHAESIDDAIGFQVRQEFLHDTVRKLAAMTPPNR